MKRDTFDAKQNAELANEEPRWLGRIDQKELDRLRHDLGLEIPARVIPDSGLLDGTSPALAGTGSAGAWGVTCPEDCTTDEDGYTSWVVHVQAPMGLAMTNDAIIHELHHGVEAVKWGKRVSEIVQHGSVLDKLHLMLDIGVPDPGDDDEEGCHDLSNEMHGKYHVAVEGMPDEGDPNHDWAVAHKDTRIDYMDDYNRVLADKGVGFVTREDVKAGRV